MTDLWWVLLILINGPIISLSMLINGPMASDAQGLASGHPSLGSRAPKLEPGQALLESLVGLSARLALDEAGSWGLWPRLFSFDNMPQNAQNHKEKNSNFWKGEYSSHFSCSWTQRLGVTYLLPQIAKPVTQLAPQFPNMAPISAMSHYVGTRWNMEILSFSSVCLSLHLQNPFCSQSSKKPRCPSLQQKEVLPLPLIWSLFPFFLPDNTCRPAAVV